MVAVTTFVPMARFAKAVHVAMESAKSIVEEVSSIPERTQSTVAAAAVHVRPVKHAIMEFVSKILGHYIMVPNPHTY